MWPFSISRQSPPAGFQHRHLFLWALQKQKTTDPLYVATSPPTALNHGSAEAVDVTGAEVTGCCFGQTRRNFLPWLVQCWTVTAAVWGFFVCVCACVCVRAPPLTLFLRGWAVCARVCGTSPLLHRSGCPLVPYRLHHAFLPHLLAAIVRAGSRDFPPSLPPLSRLSLALVWTLDRASCRDTWSAPWSRCRTAWFLCNWIYFFFLEGEEGMLSSSLENTCKEEKKVERRGWAAATDGGRDNLRESNLLVDVRSGHDYGRWEPPLWTQPAVSGPDGDKVPRRDREPVPGSELHRHPGDISVHTDVLQRRRTRQTFGSGPWLLSEDISKR